MIEHPTEVARLQEQVRAQSEQIKHLTAQVEHLYQLVDIQGPSDVPDASEAFLTTVATNEAPPTGKAPSRRSLLKWGGLGAAALAAAGAAGLSHTTAHAANGNDLILGQTNTASSDTILNSTAATGLLVTTTSNFGIIGSSSNGTSGTGVEGQASGAGSRGVFGSSDSGIGIFGQSSSGIGILGQSNTNIDLIAFGTGRILQNLSGFTGAPTSGTYSIGEQIRDNVGDLYICMAGGNPGTWRRVAAGVPGQSGSFNFLPEPIRLLDTRGGSPLTAGFTYTMKVTGVVVDGISVPSGAIGVVGNVTVVGPTSGGDLRLFPGPALPPTSSINFVAGQNIANGVTVRLNDNGQMDIRVDMASGATTNVLFDVVGYIL